MVMMKSIAYKPMKMPGSLGLNTRGRLLIVNMSLPHYQISPDYSFFIMSGV